MKHIGKKGFCVFTIIFLLTAMTSCDTKKKTKSSTEEIKIGVAIYRGDDAFISSLYKYMEQDAKKKEESTGRRITLVLADGKNSQMNQTDQLEDFINKDYDVICANLVDRTVASTIAVKAKEAGIPLVFFNREPVREDLNIWEQTYYVGSDAKEAGELAGEIVTSAYEATKEQMDKNKDGKIQYVLLEGNPGHQDALVRTEYAISTITNAGIEMERLANGTANWMRDYAYGTMNEWIREFGDGIELVISNNDDMAIGAITSLNENNDKMSKTFVVGTDGTEEGIEKVIKGEMLGTVKNDAKGQAEAIVDIAIASSIGKKVESIRPNMENRIERIPQYMVVEANVEDFVE